LKTKQEIREQIWRKLTEEGVDRFPRPIKGRIPNFENSEKAAKLLIETKEFKESGVVKVNPDYTQINVRKSVLDSGKTLIMPTPRLREGFLVLDSGKISSRDYRKASTIKHSFSFGEKIAPKDIPKIDLIVCGSVAVTVEGIRIGKGGGYSDLEYAILAELEKIDESLPIATTIHELQIIKEAPTSEHDFTVDIISTPERKIYTGGPRNRPGGIIWEILPEEKLEQIPILRSLRH
jgi:5-formyltetrahydrofolate cyclo-ligase